MTKEKTTAKSRIDVKTMVLVALMAALCCVISPISVPIGAIPISLGVLAAYLCAFALGSKKGTLAFAIYLLLGLVGLPVFSGYAGGPAKLFGPTGGYLIGMIFLVLISGLFIDRFGIRKWYMQVIGMVLGLAVCYALGTLWYMFQAKVTFAQGMATCVIPFLPVDAIKIALALLIGNTLRKALSAAHLVEY